ncbi:MAG: DUF6600 domain-containing protein [Acetobacteraceae bacterium]
MPRPPVAHIAIFGAALALSPLAAFAQGLPPAPVVPAATAEAPPAVVGWLAEPSGTVWVAPGAGQAWQPAMANQPLESGEIVATAPDGSATIEVMAMRAALAPSSEFAVDQLGAAGLSATETSGEVAFDLTTLPPGAGVAVATPRGTVEIASLGRYEIAAGAGNEPTMVTALGGPASIVNGASVQNVAPGQTVSLFTEPNGTIAASVSPAVPDPLLSALIASAPPQPQIAPPPAVAEMTGGASLAAYGTWSQVPQYGTVWFPNVSAAWAPYRYGRWSYVAPWGWTWVDADPWGFAPFHYGRWVQLGPRWGWVPVAPGISVSVGIPVYAPALVNFFAVGSIGGVGISVSAGALAAGLVGWVPLGPGEFYRPPYRVSPTYIRQVNVYSVRNINRINVTEITNNHVTINRFVDRGALTAVPASVLAEGRPVHPAFQRPSAETLASLRPLPEGVPVRPGPDRVWAKPQHLAAVHPPAPLREPETYHPSAVHPSAIHPPAGEPQHPATVEPLRPASIRPPTLPHAEPLRTEAPRAEPPRAAEPYHPATSRAPAGEPQHPATVQPLRSASIHPPVPEPPRPPADTSRPAYHPAPAQLRQAEPYRPPPRPPAETSRPAYHPAPAPPRQAEPYRPPPRPTYARPPEPPRQAEPPHPMPVHAAPHPQAPPSQHGARPPDQDQDRR